MFKLNADQLKGQNVYDIIQIIFYDFVVLNKFTMFIVTLFPFNAKKVRNIL